MRLYADGEWYDSSDPAAFPESSFEDFLIQESARIFPGYFVGLFKPRLYAPGGGVEPDLVFIDRRYRSWHIVEVERADHPLDQHVIPQVTKISDARITRDHGEQIARQLPQAERSRVVQLVEEVPHQTTVIVNAPAPGWSVPLQALGVQLAIVEIFRSPTAKLIFRLNGEQPVADSQLVTTLRPGNGWLSGIFRVDAPAAMPALPQITVLTPRGLDIWRIRKVGTDTCLFPTAMSADQIGPCDLMELEDDVFTIQIEKGKR